MLKYLKKIMFKNIKEYRYSKGAMLACVSIYFLGLVLFLFFTVAGYVLLFVEE